MGRGLFNNLEKQYFVTEMARLNRLNFSVSCVLARNTAMMTGYYYDMELHASRTKQKLILINYTALYDAAQLFSAGV